jgi:hypothetical protein
MGVPITFMDKYNPDQFEINWIYNFTILRSLKWVEPPFPNTKNTEKKFKNVVQLMEDLVYDEK